MITVYGKNEMSRDELASITVARPAEAGTSWQALDHIDLLETIENDAKSRGWDVLASEYAVEGDTQAEIVGAVNVKIPGISLNGTELGIGFVSSNSRKKSVRLYVGGTVVICSNGLVTGEIVLKKRHTKRLNIADEVREGLDRYLTAAAMLQYTVAAMQDRELRDVEIDSILANAGRAKILPWSGIGKVDAEFRAPTYADHDEKTTWGLLNAFTHIAKKINPLKQLDKINQFRATLPV